MIALIHAFAINEDGASFAEYAIVAALVAVACIAVITTLGASAQGFFASLVSGL